MQKIFSKDRKLPAAEALLLGVVLLSLTGCHRGVIRANKIPADLAAPIYTSPKQLNLTQLSKSTLSSERLYVGDVVDVSISTGIEQGQAPSWQVRIAENGAVNIPLVGVVQVAGLLMPEAERVVREESIRRGIYVNPNVSVLLKERRANRITVMGAVESPDTYMIPAVNSDLVAALAFAGWLTDDAASIVEIKQPPRANSAVIPASHPGQLPRPLQPQTVRIDLAELSAHGDSDISLEDGAIVIVKEKPPRVVHVMGLVKAPKEIKLPENKDLTLLEALSQAGGRTLQIADKVKVIRRIEGRAKPVIISASVRNAKSDGKENIRLAAGDVISVEDTPLTFAVQTIRDFVGVGLSAPVPGF